ncbi:MAG: mersacidin/lichenicidin family type 2 lantibiotic [Chloroflexi bacterium]|nr:mersacidin/lichenicidin family type 2 lantibiotic [Chloroflexota bacterium]
MSNVDVVRAWKDAEYRNSLTAEQRASLPENPAGLVELDDAMLDASVGGGTELVASLGCCGGLTNYNTCFGLTQCGFLCTRAILSNCC